MLLIVGAALVAFQRDVSVTPVRTRPPGVRRMRLTAAMDGHPGLARSMECAAQWPVARPPVLSRVWPRRVPSHGSRSQRGALPPATASGSASGAWSRSATATLKLANPSLGRAAASLFAILPAAATPAPDVRSRQGDTAFHC